MIDAFKNLAAGNKREVVLSERHELEQLIQTARAERAGMDEALVSLRERSASLTPIARSLEHLTQTMTGATTKLEEIGERLAGARRPHPGARAAWRAHPGSPGCRQAGGAELPGSDQTRWRGAEASGGDRPALVAGASRRTRVLTLSKMSTRRSRNCEASCAQRKPRSSNRSSTPARSTTSSSSFAGWRAD